MPRLPTSLSALAVGLSLLYFSGTANATPSLEVSTALGGADASEYLVRVANPDATDSSGVIELRRDSMENAAVVSKTSFAIPAKSTRYIHIPGERGARLPAYAVIGNQTVRAIERYNNGGGSVVLFDIPPSDDRRLHELRTHDGPSAVITHAIFDDTTGKPVLTQRATVYEGATMVLVPASVFEALPTAEQDALMTWVRTGGTLAVTIDSGSASATPRFVGGEFGLGRVHVLSFDPWAPASNGNLDTQEKLVKMARLAQDIRRYSNDPWLDTPTPSLDPNQGYRGVLPLTGVLLVIQALMTAFAFWRLATRRGMGSAYRFVAGSSVVSFAAVIGLGIYAKGGFGARARELSFVQAASGEPVAWVQRNRVYFASDSRTIDVTPRDPTNVLSGGSRERSSGESRAMLRVNDGKVILTNVEIRPWQTTTVTERGITSLGSGVVVERDREGKIKIVNHAGATLRNVVVAQPGGICVSFGDLADGAVINGGGKAQPCTNRGADWTNYRGDSDPGRLTLLSEIEEAPTTTDGFRIEKRTTLLRVTGDAS